MMRFVCFLLCLCSVAHCSLFPINFNTDKHTLYKRGLRPSLSGADPFDGLKFHSGYIHVGKKGGSMFYIIVPKDQSTGHLSADPSSPWLVWLQGGCASDFAMLAENGPFFFDQSGKLIQNKYSWHLLADMVYIDQPLGTGFSNAQDFCNYATSEGDVALDMQEFFEKFLHVHNEFGGRPLYITGESYAGHYIPSIAHHLVLYPVRGLKLNGIAIGNGWVDPVKQYPAYAKFALDNGLIGEVGYKFAAAALNQCVELIERKSFLALVQCNSAMTAILGKLNPYDIRLNCEVPPLCYNETHLTQFLNNPAVQEQLGVHKKWKDCDDTVHLFMLGDYDTQTTTKIQKLVDAHYKVLIYNGVEDFICNWMGTEAWIKSMHWESEEEFNKQSYQPWIIDGQKIGEYKALGNFEFVKVYDAGHMVPMDQPMAAYHLISEHLLGNSKSQKSITA